MALAGRCKPRIQGTAGALFAFALLRRGGQARLLRSTMDYRPVLRLPCCTRAQGPLLFKLLRCAPPVHEEGAERYHRPLA